jgi:hypothetical protein
MRPDPRSPACMLKTMPVHLLVACLGLPSLVLAQAQSPPPTHGNCMRDVRVTPEDEYRVLGRRASDDLLMNLVKIGKCEEVRKIEVARLQKEFVLLGRPGAEAIKHLQDAGFACKLGVHHVLDVDKATKAVIRAEQAVYECERDVQGQTTCGHFVVRLLPAAQPPSTPRDHHQAVIDQMTVVADTVYYDCQ